MLRKMAWKTDQLGGQVAQLLRGEVRRIKARLDDALGHHPPPIPPGQVARQAIEIHRFEAERFAHVSQRALRPIADYRRRNGGALARVLAIDVLDDLLAALVLEVDIDVR